MSEVLSGLGALLGKKFGERVSVKMAFGELTVETDAASIVDVLTFLRADKDCAFF
jgi:NADH-quinone oxidoreductase subunit C